MRNLLLLALLPAPALAEVPSVVADIAPVHSLVARVMEGVGEPALLVGGGADPHDFQLRPSQARAISGADAVFWIGPGLTPWLDGILDSATPGVSVELAEAPGLTERPPMFGGKDHENEGEDHAEEHDHGPEDPHVWLDPQNAAAITRAVAARLAELDPENAARYEANAEAAEAELAELEADLTAQLAPVSAKPFVVFHDAYAHFAARFGLTIAGAISPGDAHDPGAARIAALRDLVEDHGATCVFAEVLHDDGLVATLTDGLAVRTGRLDPEGTTLPPGPQVYPALMHALADQIAGCLAE